MTMRLSSFAASTRGGERPMAVLLMTSGERLPTFSIPSDCRHWPAIALIYLRLPMPRFSYFAAAADKSFH